MRTLILALIALAATSAGAQTPDPAANENLRWMEQQRQAQQSNPTERDLMALDNRLRADQAVSSARAQGVGSLTRGAPYEQQTIPAPATPAEVRRTDIPDDVLARSNASVRAVAGLAR